MKCEFKWKELRISGGLQIHGKRHGRGWNTGAEVHYGVDKGPGCIYECVEREITDYDGKHKYI